MHSKSDSSYECMLLLEQGYKSENSNIIISRTICSYFKQILLLKFRELAVYTFVTQRCHVLFTHCVCVLNSRDYYCEKFLRISYHFILHSIIEYTYLYLLFIYIYKTNKFKVDKQSSNPELRYYDSLSIYIMFVIILCLGMTESFEQYPGRWRGNSCAIIAVEQQRPYLIYQKWI